MVGKISRREIIRRIKEQNLIGDANIEECVSPASYEMRIGSYRDRFRDKAIALPIGQKIALAPKGRILIGTLETITLPTDLLGMMYMRSSFARKWILPWFQGVVDPGYSGKLTVVLHNQSDKLVELTGGDRICHIIFDVLPEPADKGYEGKYQESEGAQGAADEKPIIPVVGQALPDRLDLMGTDNLPELLSTIVKNDPDMLAKLIRSLLY